MLETISLKVVAFLLACVGGIIDLKVHKIPNKLTFLGMISGILLNLIFGGMNGVLNSLAGIGIGFVTFLLFAIGALKAGDVKLYMAVGAIGGWEFCASAMIASILAGGVVASLVMLARKDSRNGFKHLWNYVLNMIYRRQFYMYQAESESSYFSFGCCIALGTGIALFRCIK